MRARNIKPGFFDNEDLGTVSHSARLLFVGLWCLADRYGILEFRPKKIKAKVFPYDPISLNVIKLLEELSQIGAIVIWIDSDKIGHYIEIPKFLKHQKPHPQEKKSDFKQLLGESVNLIKLHEIKCNVALILGKRKEERGKRKEEQTVAQNEKTFAQNEKHLLFGKFWSAYPKKRNKGKAIAVWERKKLSGSFNEIMQGLAKSLPSEDWQKEDGQYIPYPATWLNAEGWKDEFEIEITEPESRWVPKNDD